MTVSRSVKAPKVRTEAQPFPPTLFTVTNAQVARLTPEGAVEILRDILWADARRVGIPTTAVNISSWVDVPDGGIDATVTPRAGDVKGTAIKARRTGLQVKAGTGFEPWKEADIRTALFGDKAPKKEHLGPSVRACLDPNGTYVLVCTGCDLPDAQERQALDHLKKCLS